MNKIILVTLLAFACGHGLEARTPEFKKGEDKGFWTMPKKIVAGVLAVTAVGGAVMFFNRRSDGSGSGGNGPSGGNSNPPGGGSGGAAGDGVPAPDDRRPMSSQDIHSKVNDIHTGLINKTREMFDEMSVGRFRSYAGADACVEISGQEFKISQLPSTLQDEAGKNGLEAAKELAKKIQDKIFADYSTYKREQEQYAQTSAERVAASWRRLSPEELRQRRLASIAAAQAHNEAMMQRAQGTRQGSTEVNPDGQ